MEKAVVTGGAGFIGSHLVDALLAEGFEVHSIDNFAGGRRADRLNPKATYHELDIVTADLAPIFAGAEYVFHAAALPRVQFSIEHPVESSEANITGTLKVLLAARDAKAKKVVYSASSSAYGNAEKLPVAETAAANPISPYALQKYVGELYCKLFWDVYRLPTVSLRYFNVYGPRSDPGGAYAQVIPKFLQMRLDGKPMTVTGDGTQTRDLVHVSDLARANVLAARSAKTGEGEVINIGTGSSASVNEIAEFIGGPVEHVAPRFEPHDTLADNRKAKELLGWEPKVKLEEGIAELKKEFGVA